MARTALYSACLIAALLAGCDKKRTPTAPEPTTTTTKTPVKPSTPAPKGVPQSLKDKVDREWPGIKAKGDAFLQKFDEAKAAQNSGDRSKMQAAITEASELFGSALEQWAEFENWVNDQEDDGKMTATEAERCRRFLGTYERTVKNWRKKAKPLKELMTVK